MADRPVFSSQGGGRTLSPATGLAFSHLGLSMLQEPVAYVAISIRTNASLSVTWASVPMVSISRVDQSFLSFEVFRLVNPAQGSAGVSVTAGAAANMAVVSAVVTGAHQTTPNGTPVSGSGNSTTPSGSTATLADDLVLDFLGIKDASGTPTETAGAGQTKRSRFASDSGDAVNDVIGTWSDDAGTGASVTMSWTLDGSKRWNQVIVPVRSAGIERAQGTAAAAGFSSGTALRIRPGAGTAAATAESTGAMRGTFRMIASALASASAAASMLGQFTMRAAAQAAVNVFADLTDREQVVTITGPALAIRTSATESIRIRT